MVVWIEPQQYEDQNHTRMKITASFKVEVIYIFIETSFDESPSTALNFLTSYLALVYTLSKVYIRGSLLKHKVRCFCKLIVDLTSKIDIRTRPVRTSTSSDPKY